MLEFLSDNLLTGLMKMPKQSITRKAEWGRKGNTPHIWQKNYDLKGIALDDAPAELFTGMPFHIYARRNNMIPDDFSCGIRYQQMHLARYNGPHRDHSNGPGHQYPNIIKKCHIHRATAMAQREGKKMEHYAEPTDRYSHVEGALACLVEDFCVSGINISRQLFG